MDRLSPLDVSFVHLEDGDRTAHMHIASIGIFEGPAPDQDEIRDQLLDRLHLIPRYRQRLERVPLGLARPVWVDATDFDIGYHVRRTALPAPGGDAELRALVGRIVSQRLDRTKPLWEIWIVEGVAGGRWAMIGKVHHCMVDGVSGTELLVASLDLAAEPAAYERQEWEREETSTAGVVLDAVRSLVTSSAEQARAVRGAVRRPRQALRAIGDLATGLRSSARSIAGPGRTELTGPVGSHRVIAWAAVPLDEIKAVKGALGGTINDVVLGAITNGFRELLRSRGETVDGREVRTLIPVSVRATRADGAATGDGTFDNKVSAMFAALPVGIADPVERHVAIVSELSDLKESNQALAGKALTDLSVHAPALLHALGARVVAKAMASGPSPIQTVTTNIPGPQVPLYCRGRKMVRAYAYVPVAAPVRISVAIFSYDGEVTFGVTGDREVSPDVDVFARGIVDGVAQLVKASAP